MRKQNNYQTVGGRENSLSIAQDASDQQHCAIKRSTRSHSILVVFFIALFSVGLSSNFNASPIATPKLILNWLGGGIADIYQGKNDELGVILYPDEVVTLTVKTIDGTIVVPPELYSSPDLHVISIGHLASGNYQLVARVGKKEENILFTR